MGLCSTLIYSSLPSVFPETQYCVTWAWESLSLLRFVRHHDTALLLGSQSDLNWQLKPYPDLHVKGSVCKYYSYLVNIGPCGVYSIVSLSVFTTLLDIGLIVSTYIHVYSVDWKIRMIVVCQLYCCHHVWNRSSNYYYTYIIIFFR